MIASNTDILAKKGIAALSHSLQKLNKYAIVRYVWKKNGAPRLCALIPQIGNNYECFYVV